MPSSDHYRAFPRRPTSLPAILRCDSVGHDLPAELVDLSLGGACVVLVEALALGASVRLRLDAAELWEPLLLPANVVWTKAVPLGRVRHGLRFLPESANAIAILAELIGAGTPL